MPGRAPAPPPPPPQTTRRGGWGERGREKSAREQTPAAGLAGGFLLRKTHSLTQECMGGAVRVDLLPPSWLLLRSNIDELKPVWKQLADGRGAAHGNDFISVGQSPHDISWSPTPCRRAPREGCGWQPSGARAPVPSAGLHGTKRGKSRLHSAPLNPHPKEGGGERGARRYNASSTRPTASVGRANRTCELA